MAIQIQWPDLRGLRHVASTGRLQDGHSNTMTRFKGIKTFLLCNKILLSYLIQIQWPDLRGLRLVLLRELSTPSSNHSNTMTRFKGIKTKINSPIIKQIVAFKYNDPI